MTPPTPKQRRRKIITPLDDQLDDSFPASDPPSLTDPSRSVVDSTPDEEEEQEVDPQDGTEPEDHPRP